MQHQICDECETVVHCTKHGCIPATPVARYKPVMRAADPLPSPTWRAHVNHLAYWMLMGVFGLFWLAFVLMCVHMGAT